MYYMLKFLRKVTFYNFCILLVFISSLVLVTNKVIVVYKETSEDIKINDIVHDNNSRVNTNKSDYIGVLEIPKINLKKGLVSLKSKSNSVDKNIQVISNDISDIENQSIVLAAHSGSGYKAFFKNLDKLELGNSASIYYNGRKYDYFVSQIYNESKDENIEIPNSNNLLILTTCYGKDRQLVVVLEKDYEEVS